MGTNFYFKLKNWQQLENDVEAEINKLREKYNVTVSDYWVNDASIHIAKTSCGWKPLFQQTEHYKNMSGIKEFYDKNKLEYSIFDEYGCEYNWREFIERVIEFNPEGKSHFHNKDSHYMYYHIDEFGYEFNETDFS